MSQYRKGYIAEKKVKDYMKRKYNCVCLESRGSHGLADLICGNGETVYCIQVKYGTQEPYIIWQELENLAKNFKAVPLLAYVLKKNGIFIIKSNEELKALREWLRMKAKAHDKV